MFDSLAAEEPILAEGVSLQDWLAWIHPRACASICPARFGARDVPVIYILNIYIVIAGPILIIFLFHIILILIQSWPNKKLFLGRRPCN